MTALRFLHLISPSRGEDNDDDDVTFGKRLLQLFGYGRHGPAGPTCLPSKDFFDDIREFQKDNGLKVDGVIAPDGETARTFEQKLNEKINVYSDDGEIKSWEDIDDSWGESEYEKRCAFSYIKVDIPTCKLRANDLRRKLEQEGKTEEQIERAVARAFAICRHVATDRFAACLRNVPEDDRPPLPWIDYRTLGPQ